MCHSMHYIILVTVCALLTGCRPSAQYPTELLMADSLTQCDADSAVRLLQEVAPTMSQAKEPVRRYHQLLTIKAQDKAFITHTSDSLMLDVLRYYQEEGDPCLLPEAYYYAGRVTCDLGDSPQALDYFHHALDVMQTRGYQSRVQGQEKRTLKLQGNIHAQMGYLFRSQHLYDEAITAFEQAYGVDSLNQDTTGMILDIQDIGKIYYLNSKILQALSYYEKAEQLSLIHNDSIMLFEIASNIACLYDFIGDYEIALAYFNKYPIQLTRQNSNSIYFTQADILSHLGRKEEAEKIFLNLLSLDNISIRASAFLWLGNHASNKGDDKKALKYIREYMPLEDSLNILKNEEAVALSQSLYNYQLREKEIAELKLQETKQKARTWIFTILAATAAGILYYIERARRRKIRSQYEHLRRLIAVSQQHAKLKKELSSASVADLKDSETYKNVCRKCKNNEVLTKTDWKEIESLYNIVMPNFLHNLRSIYNFNETEWKLSLLTKMDFSWHEIATLVSLSYPAVHSSQSRLHKKVFKGDVTYQNWKNFINSL